MTLVVENVSTRRKSCPSATLCTLNPTLYFAKWHGGVFTSEFPGVTGYSCFTCIWNSSFKRPTNLSFLQANDDSVLELHRSLYTLQF